MMHDGPREDQVKAGIQYAIKNRGPLKLVELVNGLYIGGSAVTFGAPAYFEKRDPKTRELVQVPTELVKGEELLEGLTYLVSRKILTFENELYSPGKNFQF